MDADVVPTRTQAHQPAGITSPGNKEPSPIERLSPVEDNTPGQEDAVINPIPIDAARLSDPGQPGHAQKPTPEKPELKDDARKAPGPSPALISEIHEIQEKLRQLQHQAALQTGVQDERALRTHFRKARFGREWVEKTEKLAKETLDERKEFADLGSETEWPVYMHQIAHLGHHGRIHPREFTDAEAVYCESSTPVKGMRPVTSLRPVYSRKLGPPSQWDDIDGDEWSSDDSISSKDFDYFRARLRGDFEWELDRLGHQRARYQKHKRNKAAKLKAESEDLEIQNEQQQREQVEGELAGEDAASCDKFAGSVILAKLNPVAWSTFKIVQDRSSQVCYAIDILIGEPDITRDSFFGYFGGKKRNVPKGAAAPKQAETHVVHYDGASVLPERIRINSKHLIKTLSMIHGSELMPREPAAEILNDSIVMLRPFRLLTYYEREVRDWYVKLVENLHGPKTAVVDSAVDAAKPLESSVAIENNDNTGAQDETPLQGLQNNVDDPDGLTKSEVTLSHLKCLIEFQDKYIVPKQRHLRSSGLSNISYSDIWHFFKPGDIVIAANGKQAYQVVKVTASRHRGSESDRWAGLFGKDRRDSKDSKSEEVSIECVYIDFDGQQLGPVSASFSIRKFDAEKEVVSLPIYPLRFLILKGQISRAIQPINENKVLEESHESRFEQLRRSFIERGRKFVRVAKVKHMYYAGVTVDPRDEVESQVMIDFDEAFIEKEEWRPKVRGLIGSTMSDQSRDASKDDDADCDAECCREEIVHDDSPIEEKLHQDFINRAVAEFQEELQDNFHKSPSPAVFPRTLEGMETWQNDLKDEELIIMSYTVFGFVLKDRTWAKLDLEYLTDVVGLNETIASTTSDQSDDGGAFGQLVLPPGHKDMILSLVSQHFRNKSRQNQKDEQVDIVRGKGKGLIMLLHGAPGVGKTTTAEGVAEKFKKPLFQITCGDLGVHAAQVETALQTTFRLANRWGCILLLDEADVFLAERRREDFTRNGTVAVFLRILEYYAGILFLTTNRIGDFDEAFVSRIHMSLYYPPLDDKSTRKVLRLNLNMIKSRFKAKGREIDVDEVDMELAVAEYWRDNKNARWNGRQIRNACQTALALAEFDAQPKDRKYDLDPVQSDDKVHLQVKHLMTVSKAYLEFIEYLKEVHGADADTHAKESGLRAGGNSSRTARNRASGKDLEPRHNPLHSFRLPDHFSVASQQVQEVRQAGHTQVPQQQHHHQQQHQREVFYTPPQDYARGAYTQTTTLRSGAPLQGNSPLSLSPSLQQAGYGQPGHAHQGMRQPQFSPSPQRTSPSYGQPVPDDYHLFERQHQFPPSQHGSNYPPSSRDGPSRGESDQQAPF